MTDESNDGLSFSSFYLGVINPLDFMQVPASTSIWWQVIV